MALCVAPHEPVEEVERVVALAALREGKVLGEAAAFLRRVAKGEGFVPHRNLTVGRGGDGEGLRGRAGARPSRTGARCFGRNKLRPSRAGEEGETGVAIREEHEFGLVAGCVEGPWDGRSGAVHADVRHVVRGHARRPVASHLAGDDARGVGLHLERPLFRRRNESRCGYASNCKNLHVFLRLRHYYSIK